MYIIIYNVVFVFSSLFETRRTDFYFKRVHCLKPFFRFLWQVEEFVAQHKETLEPLRATKKTLEHIRGCINWMKNHGKEVEDWLQSQVADSLSSRLEDL